MIDNEKYVKVVVNPLEPSKKAGGVNNTDIVITANGVYEPEPPYTGFGKVDVAVPTSSAVIEPLSITPTTSSQSIVAPEGVDGYSPISVSAVTAVIDSNIQAGNIKENVSILGVVGSLKPAPTYYVEKTLVNGELRNSTNIIDLAGVNSLDTGVFTAAYYGVSFPANTAIDFSSLKTLPNSGSCQNMFQGCSGIVSINLSGLTTISGNSACVNMFRNCQQLANVNVSSLKILSGGKACQHMFDGCVQLTTLSFPALTSASFGTNTGVFDGLIYGVAGCTIHFPSNLSPASGSTVISSLTGYPNFGGTNTVLSFDLPATS